MDLDFQRAYGRDYLRYFGTADRWPMSVQVAVAIRGYISRGFTPWPEHPPDVRPMTAKTATGWREAEALANEGCAATLDTAHEALADAIQMLQYHGHTHACQAMQPPRARLRDERNGFLERANQARGDHDEQSLRTRSKRLPAVGRYCRSRHLQGLHGAELEPFQSP